MKRVVSISLGSSKRNHKVTAEFGGQLIDIERIGTDGDKEKAVKIITELDGKVDAFGLGGMDLYIFVGGKRYTFSEAHRLVKSARITPVVDGSGLKNTLERRVIKQLQSEYNMIFKDRPVLVVSAADRFGLAESLVAAGSKTVFGDLMFGLGIPLPIRTLSGLKRLARIVAPVVTKLPISMIYPTGDKQEHIKPRYTSYFKAADIIAGDFHFIRRNMPDDLQGKTIITNTVTPYDETLLKERGVKTLVTTTPRMEGRSFGTNVLEGVLIALAGKKPEDLTTKDYEYLLDVLGIKPTVKQLSM